MGPDESGDHELSRTVEVLSSSTPQSGSPTLALSRGKTNALIGAIRQLGKASLRLYDENRKIKRLMVVGACTGALVTSLLTVALIQLDQDAVDRAALLADIEDLSIKLKAFSDRAERSNNEVKSKLKMVDSKVNDVQEHAKLGGHPELEERVIKIERRVGIKPKRATLPERVERLEKNTKGPK